jgi:aminomethyltransferase
VTDADDTVLRRTPLHAAHRELGARLVPFAGYEMPVQYGSILEEHRTVRGAVGVFDLSHMGEIEVRGDAAADFLRWVLVSDPGTLEIGQAQYSMACDVKGGVIDDLIVYRLDEDRYSVVCNASNRSAVVDHLSDAASRRDHAPMIEDRSDATGLVAPQGPRAAVALGELTDADLGAIGTYRAAPGTVAGIECMIARTGYTGEDGFELFCDADATRALWDAVLAAAERHGGSPCGLGARDTLRLEAGMPLYGNELSRDTNPYEVNLGRIVKLDKGDFIGRDALVAVAEAGPERKLVGLRMIDAAIPRQGYPVRHASVDVGHVTSGTLSPTLGDRIAMAMIPAELAGLGTAFEVVVRERPQRAEQVKLPFYRRSRD